MVGKLAEWLARFDSSEHMSEPVTVLLQQWRDGDQAALDELTPLVYDELRRLAASYLRRERDGHTLQPTCTSDASDFCGSCTRSQS